MSDVLPVVATDHSQPIFAVRVEDDLLTANRPTMPLPALDDAPTAPDSHDIYAITRVLGDDLRALHSILTTLDVPEVGQPALRIAGRRLARLATALTALTAYVRDTREEGVNALDSALSALGPDLDTLRPGSAAPHTGRPRHAPISHPTPRSVVVGSLDDVGERVAAVADLFAAHGWRVTNLGAAMPPALAVSTVAEIDPAAFVLVVGGNSAACDDTAAVITEMRTACPNIRIGLCGLASAIARVKTPVDWLADNAAELVAGVVAATPAETTPQNDVLPAAQEGTH